MKQIIAILLLGITLNTTAQSRCGTTAHYTKIEAEFPEYKSARNTVNTYTKQWISNYTDKESNAIITIPVVVHVIWKTNAENISEAQILSQITILNEDYRRTNSDKTNTPTVWNSIATDTEIEFCLAKTDPQGNLTTGITRTQTTTNSFSLSNDQMKYTNTGGKDAWPNKDYLNIWVCSLQSGVLGYATPPSSFIGTYDGVVINHENFGNISSSQSAYNLGRTATHEVGHWLNLEHIWGASGSCGNDQVTDTPKQEIENYGCPTFPSKANSCNTTNPNGDMFMNYMDYSDDACMNLFTAGQKTRMLAAINLYRKNLLNHNLCHTPTAINHIKQDNKNLIKIIDVLGRTATATKNTPLFYIYDNGTVEKKIIIE